MSGMFALHYLSCHIIFMSCILFEESYFSNPRFSLVVLRKFLQVFYRDDRESTSQLFCLGNFEPLLLRTGLILPHMLGLDIVSFPHSMSLLFFFLIFFNIKKKFKKKKLLENMLIFFSFLLIAF